MTIIVTGGAGFIGSNFIFHMLDKYPDYRIVCLDCLTYAGNLSTLAPVMDNPNFRFVKESITDREAVYKLFEEEHPDMVVNFAAESHLQMRFTEIFHWTDQTCSLQRRHQSTQAAHTAHQKLVQTFLFLHTTEHTDCL